MTVPSPAKVNLFLEVGARRPDGFHDILSLVDLLDFGDDVEAVPSDRTSVRFVSPWPVPEENTVTAALRAFAERTGISRGVAVTVVKRIPPGGGLGGGSSNAAAALSCLNTLWDAGLSADDLAGIGAGIGADVPLFFGGRRSVMSGRGEVVRPAPDGGRLSYFLAFPPFPVGTAEIYRRFDETARPGDLTRAAGKITILRSALDSGDSRGVESNLFNRLQAVCEDLHGPIREARRLLEEASGRRVCLSGSGGTLFCVCRGSAESARVKAAFELAGWTGLAAASRE